MIKQNRMKRSPLYRQAGPTRERLAQADKDFEIGGDARTGYRFTMADTPLERLLLRNRISLAEHDALRTYANHWFGAGLAGHVVSVDPNRVSGSSVGLIGSEAAAHHLLMYQGAARYIGKKCAYLAEMIACLERTPEQVGHDLGYKSPYRAREHALAGLREAGDRLAYHWSRGQR
jgi:hypothetical protein